MRTSQNIGYFSVLILLLALPSCFLMKTANTTASKPLQLYNPGRSGLHPDYYIYHNSQEESSIFFRVFASELLFNQANPEMRDQSKLHLKYNLYSSFSEKILDRTGEQEFLINKREVADYYTASLKIPTEEGKSYFLELVLTDVLRQSTQRSFILLDRFNPKSQQNFLVLTYPRSQVGFEKFYYSEERFRVVTNGIGSSQMRIAYFNPMKKLPAPPNRTEEAEAPDIEPDSVWTVMHDNQKLYELGREGIYVFYPNPDNLNGLYLVNLGENFPQIKTPEDMLPALQYLATESEYKSLIEAVDMKAAIDEFWLDLGGSFATARELIRVYYNRVVFANLYFTTDRPGWMTDQGMIYLLFGPPSQVIKTETSEEWLYSSTSSNRNYTFTFNLTPHPIKAYDYVLKRTENHRPAWNRAIQSWREGRIFSL